MSCKKFRTEFEEAGRVITISAEASAHLAACGECRAFRAEQEALRGLVNGLARVEAPADFEFRLRARIARSKDESRGNNWRRAFVPGAAWLTVAGCLVAALGIFIHFHKGGAQERVAVVKSNPVATSEKGSSVEVDNTNAAPSQQPVTGVKNGEPNTTEISAASRDDVRASVRAQRATRREKFVLPNEAVEQIAGIQPEGGRTETHVSDVMGTPIFVGTPIRLPITMPERRLEATFKDVHGAQRIVAVDPITFGARGQAPTSANMKSVTYTGVW